MEATAKSGKRRIGWAGVAMICACMFVPCSVLRAQTQPLLQITSPADGTVVHPGDSVSVVVTPAAGVTFQEVAIFPHDPLVSGQVLTSPPYDFTVQVPSTTPPGKYGLVAMGATTQDQTAYSPGIFLDVEPSAAISSIKVYPASIVMDHVGEGIPLAVTGIFADGTSADITRSTGISYSSSDPTVATVDSYGVVRAVGTGCAECVGVAMIYVRYGGKFTAVQVSTSALADTVPPTTTASLSQEPNSAGWNDSDVTVTLNAVDTGGTNPSGVQQISYSATGAQTITATSVSSSSTSFVISTEGTTTITYSATDNAGNVEPDQTLVVKLDKTPPVLNCGTADTQWHATNVSILCTASDALAGLAQSAQASFSLSTSVPQGTETANASTSSLSVCDVAGNCSEAGPISGIMVDRKPPTITITSPGANNPTYLLNQAIAANYSCTDGGSGVATCSGPVASGDNLNTSSVGAQNFAVNASDKVGNTATSSAGYSVGYNICILYDQTKAVESNATIPIKFELCDANQVDVSSSTIAVNIVGIQQISTSTSGQVVTYPAATPDANFRYSSDLGPTGGYIMNLSTKGYAAGTYALTFVAGNDPAQHSVEFQVAQ